SRIADVTNNLGNRPAVGPLQCRPLLLTNPFHYFRNRCPLRIQLRQQVFSCQCRHRLLLDKTGRPEDKETGRPGGKETGRLQVESLTPSSPCLLVCCLLVCCLLVCCLLVCCPQSPPTSPSTHHRAPAPCR